MSPEKDRKAPREEIEVAHYTKELGRPLQRKMLQRRLDDLADGSAAASEPRDEDRSVRGGEPPREDRAG